MEKPLVDLLADKKRLKTKKFQENAQKKKEKRPE